MTYLPQTIIDSEGNQVEVFTPEEVQAKVEEQKKQVEGAQEELRKLKEKDLNFEKLRMNKTAITAIATSISMSVKPLLCRFSPQRKNS